MAERQLPKLHTGVRFPSPALSRQSTELGALAENEGEKKLLRAPEPVATAPFPAAKFEIDIPEDLASLCS